MVGDVRSGLHSAIGDAAEELSRVVEMRNREHHPERYREPLDHLDRTRALLDVIGWGDVAPTAAAWVDLREHRWALTSALELALLTANQDLEEADVVDAERAKRGEPSRRDATTTRVLILRDYVSAVKAEVVRPQADESDTGGGAP